MQVNDNLNRLKSLLFGTELAAERKDFSSAQICSLRSTVPLDLSSTMLSSPLFSAKPSPSSVRLVVRAFLIPIGATECQHRRLESPTSSPLMASAASINLSVSVIVTISKKQQSTPPLGDPTRR
ncbi:hypothetical protein RchiOBHm_Chr4g0408541 [Rosa chinensis]|uniref:FIGL1 N-terminal domain-containing protein n=1 Tax=Rosa chinensis TaxID=74649 RepID=A0A2P6QUV8_ROSCH|nr:hypothetical protein RchiOBHm_Chr4g0408541 [Rosa chinensis]